MVTESGIEKAPALRPGLKLSRGLTREETQKNPSFLAE